MKMLKAVCGGSHYAKPLVREVNKCSRKKRNGKRKTGKRKNGKKKSGENPKGFHVFLVFFLTRKVFSIQSI